MRRKHREEYEPDLIYQSRKYKFINYLTKDGKKTLLESFYQAMEFIKENQAGSFERLLLLLKIFLLNRS